MNSFGGIVLMYTNTIVVVVVDDYTTELLDGFGAVFHFVRICSTRRIECGSILSLPESRVKKAETRLVL